MHEFDPEPLASEKDPHAIIRMLLSYLEVATRRCENEAQFHKAIIELVREAQQDDIDREVRKIIGD